MHAWPCIVIYVQSQTHLFSHGQLQNAVDLEGYSMIELEGYAWQLKYGHMQQVHHMMEVPAYAG